MANLVFTDDIKKDVLFRAGEPTNGSSDFEAEVLQYINRAYMTLCVGGLEFNEDIQEAWWWLRKNQPGVLILQAPYTVGSASVTNNSNVVILSSPPTFPAEGYFFRATNTGDVFRVESHAGSSSDIILDSVYTGESATDTTYSLYKLEYELASDVMRMLSPMRIYSGGYYEIDGTELTALDRDYPLALTETGVPDKFANVTETRVRFNRAGLTTGGGLIRVEYDYLRVPPPLTNAENEEPLVPVQFRHILSDMALFFLYVVKDDNRDVKMAEMAKRGIRAMSMENKHRMIAYSRDFGLITPRYPPSQQHPLRTESGFIIR